MTNAHTKLLRLIRRGKLDEANLLFADVMQQKAADRLAEERKTLMKEDDHLTEESKSVAMECQECGKKFKSANTSDPKCPKCGGYDIDIA